MTNMEEGGKGVGCHRHPFILRLNIGKEQTKKPISFLTTLLHSTQIMVGNCLFFFSLSLSQCVSPVLSQQQPKRRHNADVMATNTCHHHEGISKQPIIKGITKDNKMAQQKKDF